MIDIDTRFEEQLIVEIKKYFRENILPEVINYTKTIPMTDKKMAFEHIFSDDAILSLIDASPDDLESYSLRVYDTFPELAERYHPYLIYKNITEDLSIIDDINVITGHEDLIDSKSRSVLRQINEFNAAHNRDLFNAVKLNLEEKSTKTNKLKALKRVSNILSDNYKITNSYRNSLPEWTRSPFNMFDYDSFRKIFGKRIIESHKLTPCPFCAYDSVQIVTGKRKTYLPALDHYLPKSKYPFLALSVKNLLPTCNRCNSSFKGEVDMYKNYYHPLRDRIHNLSIFNFTLELDALFERPSLNSLSIKIECENTKIMNNAKIFELDALYNLPSFKRIYFDMRERYELYKGMGEEEIKEIISDNKLTRLKLDVDRDADPQKTPLQKFKLEILHELSR